MRESRADPYTSQWRPSAASPTPRPICSGHYCNHRDRALKISIPYRSSLLPHFPLSSLLPPPSYFPLSPSFPHVLHLLPPMPSMYHPRSPPRSYILSTHSCRFSSFASALSPLSSLYLSLSLSSLHPFPFPPLSQSPHSPSSLLSPLSHLSLSLSLSLPLSLSPTTCHVGSSASWRAHSPRAPRRPASGLPLPSPSRGRRLQALTGHW